MKKGQKMTTEQKNKIGLANKGKIRSLELRKRWSLAHANQKPHIHTKEEKEKISKNRKGKCTGENHPRWKGGIWRDNKKEYSRFKCLERVARKNNAQGFHTIGEWETLKAQYNWTCPCCGKSEPEIKLTEDHIIPLIKGGSNNIENIQPLCGRCNSSKGVKIIVYD